MDNSNSLFRDMIQTTLDNDLNKTELQVFLVLLMQTLGFGKASDPLTYGRIANTMHKRKDHVKAAMKTLLNVELFDAIKHPRFEYRYRIGTKFLQKHRGDFFTPTLPKTGEGLRKMEKFSENWEHTVLYPYNSLPKQLQTNPTERNCTKNHQPNPNPSCCCGCDKNREHQEPPIFVETAPPPSQTNADANAVKEHSAIQAKAETEPLAETAHSEQQAKAEALAAQAHSTMQARAESEVINKPTAKPVQPVQSNNQFQAMTSASTEAEPFDWSGVKLPTLPKNIRPENHAFIYGLFKQGNLQQAENALIAYDNMQKTKFIHSPTGLLRRLSEWSQSDDLTLPDVVETASPKNDPSQKPLHASHQPYNANPLAHLSPEEQAQRKLNDDIAYLTDVSKRSTESLPDIAKTMHMEHILPHMQTQIEAEKQAQASKLAKQSAKQSSDNTPAQQQEDKQTNSIKSTLAALKKALTEKNSV